MFRTVIGAATIAVLAACALSSAAAARAAQPRPVVLLLHPGGFVFNTDMPYAEEVAERMGFRPRYVDYPEFDLRGAVKAARRAAQRARRNGHQVYAYGESAGGLLAAVLAQERRVAAASTYAPVADLVKFARGFDDPESYQRLINASDRDMRRFSPARHDSSRPIFAMRSVNDSPRFNNWIRNWDLRDPEVHSVVVPGDHLGSENQPSVARTNRRRALRWLAGVASVTGRT